MKSLTLNSARLVLVAAFAIGLLPGLVVAQPAKARVGSPAGLVESELCGIFTRANLSGVKWKIDADIATELFLQSETAVWRDLPATLRCGKRGKVVILVAKDGSVFESYATFRYPKGTIGVGSDMSYVAIRTKTVAGQESNGSGICTFDGAENKWFQSGPASKACVRL
jgi:hypothetical protein